MRPDGAGDAQFSGNRFYFLLHKSAQRHDEVSGSVRVPGWRALVQDLLYLCGNTLD
jgi:hypothetical protein